MALYIVRALMKCLPRSEGRSGHTSMATHDPLCPSSTRLLAGGMGPPSAKKYLYKSVIHLNTIQNLKSC